METRKITIVATREQKKYVINSAATTLGELKEDLRNAGVNYTDMAFMEGLTRTELKDDASILPHDVPRVNRETGEAYTTNELVFMLTNNSKKIASGADRKEIYVFIKANNLEEAIKQAFGKNFTMCKTSDLEEFISHLNNAAQQVAQKAEEIAAAVEEEDKEEENVVKCPCEEAIIELLEVLEENDCIAGYERKRILNILNGEEEPSTPSSYSDEEIDEMFKGL